MNNITEEWLIENDPDYINSPKHGNSLQELMDQHPDGVDDKTICKVLCITQKQLDERYRYAIMMLREELAQDE